MTTQVANEIVEVSGTFCDVCGIFGGAVKRADGKWYMYCDNCAAQKHHAEDCRWATANRCPISFPCDEHGLDVCPDCDACNCGSWERTKGRLLPDVRR